ncbi:hypothetical protein REPUB_Repub20aG0133100 [Reevesia pubescens]
MKDVLSGGSLTSAPSESLFFIDKSKDLSVKRKTEKKREKFNIVVKLDWCRKQSIILAVEVEPSGCSYNPSFESHQDSRAQVVVEEMQKVYKIELGPQPVPLIVMGE